MSISSASLTIFLSALMSGVPEDLITHLVRECAVAQLPDMKLYRMELDVTGDGSPELFLSSEESRGVGGQEWCIYSSRPEADGYDYLGRLFFHGYGFRYDEETGEFAVWIRYSASEGQVASYRIDAAGIHGSGGGSERLASGDPTHEKEWEKFSKWRQGKKVEIMYTGFASLFQRTPATWRYVSTDNPVAHDVSSLKQSEVMSSVKQ